MVVVDPTESRRHLDVEVEEATQRGGLAMRDARVRMWNLNLEIAVGGMVSGVMIDIPWVMMMVTEARQEAAIREVFDGGAELVVGAGGHGTLPCLRYEVASSGAHRCPAPFSAASLCLDHSFATTPGAVSGQGRAHDVRAN
jgi:hypothetical protein